MNPRIWGTSSNGLIRYASLSQNTLKGALDLMRNCFLKEEPVSSAIGLSRNKDAIFELDYLTTESAKHGVSLVAVEQSSGKVAGCMINKLWIKNVAKSFPTATFKTTQARIYNELTLTVDKAVNYFDLFQSDCCLELAFAVVLPDFRKQGINRTLTELSVELAQKLKNGENVKTPLDHKELPSWPVPTGVIGVCRNASTKSTLENLGFLPAAEVNLNKELRNITTSKIAPVSVFYKLLK